MSDCDRRAPSSSGVRVLRLTVWAAVLVACGSSEGSDRRPGGGELVAAAARGDTAAVERLLAAGADVNAGVGGDTPLHGAAQHGQTAMARWLLDHGADPAARNSSGQTPHAVAEAAGHAETAALLAGVE